MKKISRIIRQLRCQKGFTLIELVVVLISTSIIMAATLPLFKVQTESYVRVRDGKKLVQEARIGFNRMIAELRLVDASSDILYGYSNEIRIDIASQSLFDIQYKLSNGTLYREGVRLIDGVRSFTLTYYNASGSQISVPFALSSQVWRIKVKLEAGDSGNQIVLQSQISPRNFHF